MNIELVAEDSFTIFERQYPLNIFLITDPVLQYYRCYYNNDVFDLVLNEEFIWEDIDRGVTEYSLFLGAIIESKFF